MCRVAYISDWGNCGLTGYSSGCHCSLLTIKKRLAATTTTTSSYKVNHFCSFGFCFQLRIIFTFEGGVWVWHVIEFGPVGDNITGLNCFLFGKINEVIDRKTNIVQL